MSLPDEYRLHNRLYAAMLNKFFPTFFDSIPWQQTGKPVGLINPNSLSSRAVKKCLKVFENISGVSGSKKYTNYARWICDPQISSVIADMLDSRYSKYRQLTKINVVEEYLQPHLERKYIDNSNKILRATTVELYLRGLDSQL